MSDRITGRVEEQGPGGADVLATLADRDTPLVLRGIAADWPAVAAARQSDAALARYIHTLDTGKPAEIFVGPPGIGGRFFYDDAMRRINFQKRAGPLSALADRLLAIRGVAEPDSLYAGAVALDTHLPGWTDANALPFTLPLATPRIWFGNATYVSTHFDESSNIAVVVAGRRRFTLFPPQQLENLYVGPFHWTIAGPLVSMVDPENPDLERYPRFAEAIAHGLVAELEPGDALYVPPIWWHSVRATGPFNAMVNYWWQPPGGSSAISALVHAVMAIRDLPPSQRGVWKQWFEHFVFDDDAAQAADHLPEHVRGAVGPASPERDAILRNHLVKVLAGNG